MRHGRLAALFLGGSLLGSAVGIASASGDRLLAPAADRPSTPSADGRGLPDQALGIGETVVLVVGGRYATTADARAAAQRLAFGELQGFYVDAAANYDVLGYYEQTTPDRVAVDCETGWRNYRLECRPGQREWTLHPAIQLTYHALGPDLMPVRDAEGCGLVGAPPCTVDRMLKLINETGKEFRDGQLLVSAFRTKVGASAFMDLARAAGAEEVIAFRVVKTGGGYVGLGQEPHPDGSGPLLGPLPDAAAYQE